MPLSLLNHSALALFAQRTRIPTSARSIGFCAIWVCISSSSKSWQGRLGFGCLLRSWNPKISGNSRESMGIYGNSRESREFPRPSPGVQQCKCASNVTFACKLMAVTYNYKYFLETKPAQNNPGLFRTSTLFQAPPRMAPNPRRRRCPP